MTNNVIRKTTFTVTRITSVIIMLVALIIVLSTATFAWYTSSTYVQASDISFTASSLDSTNSLTIGWDTSSNDSTITFADINGQVMIPMIPKYNASVNTTSYNQFKHFIQAGSSFNKEITYTEDATPTSLHNLDNTLSEFYLNNRQPESIYVTLAYNIDYILNNNEEYDEEEYNYLKSYKCALFSSLPNETDTKLIGILSTDDKIHFGEISIGDKDSNVNLMENVYIESGNLQLLIPANNSLKLRAVVWFDGVNMTDKDQNKAISFSMNFVAN